MKTMLRNAAAALVMVLASSSVEAHDFTVGDIQIAHPWTRATPAGARVAGGYVAIENKGKTADTLISATAEVAGRVEIHEMAVKDGIMTMRPLAAGIEVKPGANVEMKPGGYHIMLMDLKRQLKEGEKVKGTLQFEKAGTVAVEFDVQSIGARDATHKH